ncbi:hypothetical protein M8J76_011246 [Diaphorina citri]|nr:hypothetical protein M8J76_011246 [Diaphorina citri]
MHFVPCSLTIGPLEVFLKERARKSFSGTGLKISRLKLRKSKSKEKGLDTTDEHELNAPLDSEPGPSDPKTPTSPVDYVCVPKHEYEQMEKRVSQIETRISQEFGRNRLDDDDSRVDSGDCRVEPKSRRPSIENVQTEYVKTLDKVEQLNSTCDNLAERLGRDLRIRRSYDGSRIHRSPSARKIGSLRRRSRERAAKPLSRHHSLNIHDKSPSHRMERTRSVRRRNSNAAVSVSSGVGKSTTGDKSPGKDTAARGRITRQTAPRRAQSCLVGAKRSNIPVKQVGPGWQCAQTFLRKPVPPMLMETRRDSIAKLKEQNAGMVMAKAKLFDHYADENEKGKEETGLEGKMRHRTRLSMTGVNVKPAEEGSRVLRRSMPYQDLTSGRRKSIASENINPVKKPQENISQRMSIDDPATRGLRKSLAEVTGNKENLLSETLENIIYDTCKVRTPDMPIIKKPLTGTRSISFRQPQGTRTPMPLTATPRRSPRLVELKTRPLIS